jgi:hypothetical protein
MRGWGPSPFTRLECEALALLIEPAECEALARSAGSPAWGAGNRLAFQGSESSVSSVDRCQWPPVVEIIIDIEFLASMSLCPWPLITRSIAGRQPLPKRPPL